jgi:hypothetical protein
MHVWPVSGLTFTQTAFPAKQPVAKWLSRQNVLAECLPLRGQLRQSLLLQAKIPDSRLTTTLESNREHLTL